jgi:NADH-quinone oxidoreductase subunit C
MSDAADLVRERFASVAHDTYLSHGMPVLMLPRAAVHATVAALQAELGFDMLLDVTAVDWPDAAERFEVVWHLFSTSRLVRVRLKTRVTAADPVVPTLRQLYGSADIMERECHDMYGIVFEGNPDLRPILLYEGFEGHPLRKDYAKEREQPLVPYRTGAMER